VAQHDSRQRFAFDVQHRVALDLRKIPHLRLGEFDVGKITLA
jgi:hypothetical protein